MNVKELEFDVKDIKDMNKSYEDLYSRAEKTGDDNLYSKAYRVKDEFHDACRDFVLHCKNIMSFDGDYDAGEHWVLQKIRLFTERVLNGVENKARKDLYVSEEDERYYVVIATRIIKLIDQQFVIIAEFPWNNGYIHSEIVTITNNVFEVGSYISENSRSEQKDMVIKPRTVGESWVSGVKR